MINIYILLPVHNRIETTKTFIECLLKQTFDNYHLILIDDGSTDGTAEMVRKQLNDVTIITGNGNLWWGGALQQGYLWLRDRLACTDDYVLIMNDDTIFASDFIETGIDIIKGNSQSFLVARSYSNTTKKLINLGTFYFDFKKGDFFQTDDLQIVNCTNTRALLFKVQDFLSIGGFRPKLLPHYLSDIEFTHRAIKKGFTPLPNSSFTLTVDEDLTGYHSHKSKTIFSKIKVIFSKKNSGNPIYMSIFFMLTCPWQWKLLNVFKIYLKPLKNSLKNLRNS